MKKDDSLELAENKLLILYIISKIKLPLSNLQLTDIVLENNFLDYFNYQQYLLELSSSQLIKYVGTEDKIRLSITDKGEKVLNMFFNRISTNKIDTINVYLEKHMDNIKKQITVTADYNIINSSNFVVSLGAYENDSVLLELKLMVPTHKQAKNLCTKWKNNSSELYNNVLKTLINET